MIDTHTHYVHKRFDSGRDMIIKGLKECGIIAAVEGAIDFDSNQRMKYLSETFPQIYMTTGCHPNCIEEMNAEKYKEIVDFLEYDKVVGIGETGLDYARNKTREQIHSQQEWFERFIKLSISVGKPLVVHCRDAYDDLINILQKYTLLERPGVIHSFNGDAEQARTVIELGFFLGVNGMFTKMNEESPLRSVLRTVPLESIVLETDSPYLLPAHIEGKRNTSYNLHHIVEKLAELRGESAEYIKAVVLDNTRVLYPTIFADIKRTKRGKKCIPTILSRPKLDRN